MIKITKTKLLAYFAEKNKTQSAAPAVKTSAETTLTPAAVLIPIIDDEHELLVLFTQRTEQLSNHAGQISFPGGKMEAIDQSLEETALRETAEEIGLAPNAIKLLGTCNPAGSSTGFLVTPFVGIITPPLQLKIDPREVASVFTAPLNFVLDPVHQQQQVIAYKGQQRNIMVIQYGEHRIWGLTAAILVNFGRDLQTTLNAV